MPDWKNLVSSILRPKKWIADKCLICGEKLMDIDEGRMFLCKNGHHFGPDGKRVTLINKGDHHGDL